MRTLRIATRGSNQARTQAEHVARQLRRSGVATELVFVTTTGDVRTDVPLHSIGGQGVFVKEVQLAVLDGRADVAVHSAKDLPSTPARGLELAAFCARRDPRDALVGRALDELDHGATVATGSVRRRAQLALTRPDLSFVELRGNIATRLSSVPDGGSILIAVAALEILGMTDRLAQVLAVDEMVPAVGQGCVAVECRTDDFDTAELVAPVDDQVARREVELERAYLAELGSGCTLPVGAHVVGERWWRFLAGPQGWTRRAEALPGGLDAVRLAARADQQAVGSGPAG